MVKVEVCAESLASALTAEENGAFRVELCDNMGEGGTTPSYGTIAQVRERTRIALYPIIRPRGGDYRYDDAEFEIMMRDLEMCGRIGCDGITTGILRDEGSVDTERVALLVREARSMGMGVTFHRAFDVTRDRNRALEDIIGLGCERVLTSGGAATACEGMAEICRLVLQAAGRIAVMAGSGITPQNAKTIITGTGCPEIHGTFRRRYGSCSQAPKPAWADFRVWHADPQKVRAVVDIANNHQTVPGL